MKSDEFGRPDEGRGFRPKRQVADPGAHGCEAQGWAEADQGARGGKNRQKCRKVMNRRSGTARRWHQGWGLRVLSPDSPRFQILPGTILGRARRDRLYG